MTGTLRIVAALSFVVAAHAGAQPAANSPFPHGRHARLFPTCAGCHSGIPVGNAVQSFPSAGLCANCHDGVIQRRVNWTPPVSRGAGLLVFSHVSHLAKARQVTCENCHSVMDTTQWMNVAKAVPERCASCHAHTATMHLAADNACATCHRPLTSATALSDSVVAALPRPPWHDRADFVSTHGAAAKASALNAATCAVCHARESCERCHVDGARAPFIRALNTDARVARVERGKPPVYPTPSDHKASQFVLRHGTTARATVARCATCHTRTSCEACHTGEGAQDVLRRLPDAREATAPGVQLKAATPTAAVPTTGFLLNAATPLQAPTLQVPPDTTPRRVRVHQSGFLKAHGMVAASGELSCAGCHSQRFCADCHAGERVTRRYHPANFLATHAPQAYGREVDCTTCHSTEAFCRSCHRQAGIAAKTNARSTVFHNAQPLWLLQHGRAARQDLPSCTTCHQQTYCMQCHSDLGARINPHGPGFNATAMSSRNPQLCLMCHFKNPLGG